MLVSFRFCVDTHVCILLTLVSHHDATIRLTFLWHLFQTVLAPFRMNYNNFGDPFSSTNIQISVCSILKFYAGRSHQPQLYSLPSCLVLFCSFLLLWVQLSWVFRTLGDWLESSCVSLLALVSLCCREVISDLAPLPPLLLLGSSGWLFRGRRDSQR